MENEGLVIHQLNPKEQKNKDATNTKLALEMDKKKDANEDELL